MSHSRRPADRNTKESPLSKRQRTEIPKDRPTTPPPDTSAGTSSETRKVRDDFSGGVSVIKFLGLSGVVIPEDRPLSEDGKKRVASVLQGMKIRDTHGSTNKKFTFHGLTSELTEDFEPVDTAHKSGLIYKKLPCLDLGMAANRNPIYLSMEWCTVYMEDNKSNEKLRRIFSPETLQERNYLGDKLLAREWRIVYLGQHMEQNKVNIIKFAESLAKKCGKPLDYVIIDICDATKLKEGLASASNHEQPGNDESRDTRNAEELGNKSPTLQILLCVMEEQNTPFYKALKREAEVEKEIRIKCCDLEKVMNCCDLSENSDELKESEYVNNLALKMIAKAGKYKEKAVLPQSALPSRFPTDCKVMYFGCNVINSSPHVTVLVGNMSPSDRSTSQYESSVARGDYMQELPDMFSELLNKYKEVNTSFPNKIIFFRQGFVGGRRQEMLGKEVGDLRKKAENVPITFIVFQKSTATQSMNVGDVKANYKIVSDENGICSSEFETLIKNLCYSRYQPKPLPAFYACHAGKMANICFGGKENPDPEKVKKAIDNSLYVRGVHKSTSPQNQPTEQQVQQMQE